MRTLDHRRARGRGGGREHRGGWRLDGVRRIYTRDTDFHRFPFVEVVDPLTGA
jgi:hypothetical protein